MTRYDLYLDHGPKRRTTMVHVIALMGCVHNGPTTDEVLEEMPDAIRGFLRFLAEHGDERADPDAPFTTRIAEEVTKGQMLGSGVEVFGPDHDPIKPAELKRLVTRHGWIREAMLKDVAALDGKALAAKPARGRPIGAILQHVMGADCSYLSSGLRSNRDLNALARDAEKGELDVREALDEGERLFAADLLATTPAERSAVIPRGQLIGSVRRTLRRSLEHNWEHLLEIRTRLGSR
jgi:predicted RNase H-like HicB family nuclease